MSDSPRHDPSRRHFLAGSAAAASLAAAMNGAEAHVAAALDSWAPAGASIVLHDPGLAISPDILRQLNARGARAIALHGDPVWFWRSTANGPLRDPATQLVGITGWADLLVFRGLAAETRRHLRYERLASEGVFIWLIA